MAEPVFLPKVGMTMEEGTLARWLVPDGAAVKTGEPIFELETEKVEMEVEAEAEGVLRHLVAEDTKLKPGGVVACILSPGEEIPQALLERVRQQAAGEATPAETEPPAAAAGASVGDGERRLRATPIARRLAAEHGIDLAAIKGSGPEGRVTEQDVRRAVEARAPPAPEPAAPSPRAEPPSGTSKGKAIAYRGRRRTIGERMHQSLQTMAQLTLASETAVDQALEMLHGLNREWRRDGVTVSLTALVVRACALALRDHPALNAILYGDEIVLKPEVNVGIAVDLDEGLMVPVVRDADRRPLKEVAGALRDLLERAKADSLTLDDVSGGTFTVTSLEGSAVDAFTPIVNPPQAAILGVGRVREVAAFEGATVVRRQIATLSLTFDHRVTDGAPAARFLSRVAELLQRPYLLM